MSIFVVSTHYSVGQRARIDTLLKPLKQECPIKVGLPIATKITYSVIKHVPLKRFEGGNHNLLFICHDDVMSI